MVTRLLRITCAISFLLAAALLPVTVLAQEDLTINSLVISIWPEYDHPSALVLMTGILEGDGGEVDLSFPLPIGAEINAVAYLEDSGQFNNMQYTIDGGNLEATSPNGTFHVEYYDTSLQFDAGQRSFSTIWLSDMAVNSLVWEIKQPVGSTAFAITPSAETISQDTDGLLLYQINAGSVDAGEAARLTFAYSRVTDQLTVDMLNQSPDGSDAPPDAEEGLISRDVFNIGMFVFLIILAAIAGYFYGDSRRARASLKEMVQTQDTAAASTAPAAPQVNPVEAAMADGLTRREVEVLQHVAEGHLNEDIGEALGISPKTVGRHRENIMRKLKVHSRSDLVKYAIRTGLISVHDED